jgi:hypothetical protein
MTVQTEQSQPKTLDSDKFLESFRAKKYPPKRYKRKNLSPEFIEAARQRCLVHRPWEKSTGPRDKSKCGKNNIRHGRRSKAMQEVNKIITQVVRLVRNAKEE